MRLLLIALTLFSINSFAAISTLLPNNNAHPPKLIIKAHSDIDAISSPLPTFPEASYKRGHRGWSEIAYSIDQQGQVLKPYLKDSNGHRQLDQASLRVIKQWEFKPLILKGKPIFQQYASTTFTFNSSGIARDITSLFSNSHKRAKQHIADGNLKKAHEEIAILAKTPRVNLYEDGLYWLVKSQYFHATNDKPKKLSALKKAAYFNGKNLSKHNYAIALENLFSEQITAQLYQDALNSYKKLERIDPERAEKFNTYYEKLIELSKSNTPILISGRINKHQQWQHTLLKQNFYLDGDLEHLSHIDIRCHKKRQLINITADATWSIPKQWQNCKVYIIGEPDTQFSLYETAL